MIKPLGDWVAVKPLERESILHVVEKTTTLFEVVAANKELPLTAGTKVVVSKYSGEELTHNGETIIFVKFEDILTEVE